MFFFDLHKWFTFLKDRKLVEERIIEGEVWFIHETMQKVNWSFPLTSFFLSFKNPKKIFKLTFHSALRDFLISLSDSVKELRNKKKDYWRLLRQKKFLRVILISICIFSHRFFSLISYSACSTQSFVYHTDGRCREVDQKNQKDDQSSIKKRSLQVGSKIAKICHYSLLLIYGGTKKRDCHLFKERGIFHIFWTNVITLALRLSRRILVRQDVGWKGDWNRGKNRYSYQEWRRRTPPLLLHWVKSHSFEGQLWSRFFFHRK